MKTKIKLSLSDSLFYWIVNIILFLVIVIMLFPFLYVFANSISERWAVTRGEIWLIPKGINLSSYEAMIQNKNFFKAYGYSVFYAVFGTVINLIMTALIAFPLSRTRLWGRSFFRFMVVVPMLFSGGMIPSYLVVRGLHMINTVWAIVIPGAISSFNTIIMINFFSGLPPSLDEAAFIDGANDIQILMNIVMPLSLPIFATVGLYYMVGHWNDYFSALIYLSDSSKHPVTMILRRMVVQSSLAEELTGNPDLSPQGVKYASIILSIIPMLCIYPFIQKYFVAGTISGAVKG